ncbi:MAG: UDP-N-acetylglucosamine 1-carboxyvinyltransferase [Candidatus Sumerlaeota bacterium]|nr:UDP-N-acetylglucosamine 1-carboxyvinyltransferase [Candidatus Sumerlaeota bacterium]
MTSPLIRIEGPTPLFGEIDVRGAKNAALPLLMAAAAGSAPVTLTNLPTELRDIQAEIEALRYIGCNVEQADGTATLALSDPTTTELPPEISGKIRTSLLFLGLLAGRFGHAKITMPGGCDLGDRKFDLHLEGLRLLGADIHVDEHSIEVTAKKLKGADIHFYLPSTTGTENVMIAACFAEGRTRIFNANTRPEVADLAVCLNAMGARISVRNRVVEVEGGRLLGGATHKVMKGWDEAVTYILAAGLSGGEICIRDFSTDFIRNDVAYMRDAGLDVFEWGGNLYASGKGKKLRAFDLFTAPYPGVNSDMQPLFAAFASKCEGSTSVTDQRFTERFQYAAELRKMGVPIESYGNCAVIEGPARLKGANVRALDLRCGAALVMAGLAAEGTTVIDNCQQIYRGYELLVPRLRSLGANISGETEETNVRLQPSHA